MDINFTENEPKILRWWQENKIFEKSIKTRPKSRQFVFYEGPPTANGKPGLHHVLARVFKDIICRYKTMQGFRVLRKAGWDTHGLPVELEVEKELGLKSKKEIEKYGIAEFNKKCRQSVWKYKKLWEDLTERIGFWLDIKNAYITYEPEYIETVWYIIKQIWQKGLLYQGFKVVPYCPRCGTSLSSHEVAQGYKKVKEQAVYVKFNVKYQMSNLKDYLLSWTTTPWTLPGNVALAVNPELDYVLVEMNDEGLILAKDRLNVLGGDCRIKQEFKGKDLVNLEYQPLFDIKELQSETSYRVYPADFVSAQEGTGIVHTAVMYGVDDFELGKKYHLPQRHTVDKQGRFNNLVQGFEGQYVKGLSTEKSLVDYLKDNNLLFKQDLYQHDYPFCWRCQSPLLYYGKDTWFIKMTAIKERLIVNNQKINWVPAHLKEGRFGEWLQEVKDWALSRERYWGTPLPLWQCQIGKTQNPKIKYQNGKSKFKDIKKCQNIKAIGSVKELEELSGKKIREVHRPAIDKITFKCEKCGGAMKRVPEVIDCWFDSGAMPFAQNRWFWAKSQKSKVKTQKSKKEKLKPPELFPADYISEAIDQTRGWFYTLLAISTALGFGPAYRNVISLGHVLDEKGEKMSKSRGNVIDPWLVINKYGADAVRWFFFTVNQPGDSKQVGMQSIENVLKKFIMTLWNCFSFFETYVPKKEFSIFNLAKRQFSIKPQFSIFKNILDKWVVSKLNGLILEATKKLDSYDITGAARKIEKFVIDDLSLWYIRRSRKRFQNPQTEKELRDASVVLGHILLIVSRLTAPFIPFLAEELYQKISGFPEAESRSTTSSLWGRQVSGKNSVHLQDWPTANKRLVNKDLDQKMNLVREVVSSGLKARAEAQKKVRQPLRELRIDGEKYKQLRKEKELLELIREEVNVKNIVFDYRVEIKDKVKLDTEITLELKEEGIIREVMRQIQERRKRAGLKPEDKILVRYSGSPRLEGLLEKHKIFFSDEARIKDFACLQKESKRSFDSQKEIKVGDEKLWLGIRRTKEPKN